MNFHFSSSYSHARFSHTLTEKPQPSEFERHCHSRYEILYVVNGRGKYIVEGVSYPLEPHTLLLIHPHEFHYVCPQKDVPYERHVINFPQELFCDHPALSAFLASAEGKHGLYFPAEVLHNSLNGIFCNLDAARTLFEGAGHRQAKEGAMMQADLLRILLLLSLSEPKEAEGEGGNIIPGVIEYLNDHLEREISLDKLAQKFFVSKYYLCHAFRKHTGVSVFTYLSTKRIAMAEQLLAKGEPATSVAYQVGFQNYSSFYRSFCKLKGRAPVYSHGGEKEGSKP